MKKDLLIFFVVILVAIFFRFYNLGNIPISMSDDEIRESMSAYSFITSGKDLYGMSYPLSFNLDGFVFAPVTTYMVGLFIGLFGLSMWGARVGYAVAGVMSVIGVYLLSYEILKNRYISLLSMFGAAVSVWAINVSRFAHEGIFSLMFMTFATYFLIRTKKNDYKNLVVSFVLFFCAFYSYAAIKLDVLPVVLVVLVFKFKEWKKKQIIAVLGSLILLFGSFFVLSKIQNAAQYGAYPFYFMDKSTIANEVELQRRNSNAPPFLETLYHNKFSYIASIAVYNYLYAFSFQYLFLSQEASGIYSMWDRGQMYLIELPLFLIGILFAFTKYRKQFFLMLSLLLIAPLPSVIGTMPTSYTMRSIYMIPFLYLFAGIGVFHLVNIIKAKSLRNLVVVILLIAYLYSVGRYFVQYTYDWKIHNASAFAKSTEDAISYIDQNKGNYEKVFLVGYPKNTFLHYAFIHKLPIETIQIIMNSRDTGYGNINFIGECLGGERGDPKEFINERILYIAPVNCHKKAAKKGVIKNATGKDVVYGIY